MRIHDYIEQIARAVADARKQGREVDTPKVIETAKGRCPFCREPCEVSDTAIGRVFGCECVPGDRIYAIGGDATIVRGPDGELYWQRGAGGSVKLTESRSVNGGEVP